MDPNVFEINPLDLGIAEIQFKLKRQIEAIKDTSDFDLISEKFISKSPCMIPFTIEVRCFMDTSVENGLVIQIHLYDKEGKGIMVEGKTESKEDLLQEIECRDFFFSCKKLVLEFLKRAETKN